MLTMLLVAVLGTRVPDAHGDGRHIFAFGGNLEASRFAGLPLNRIQIGVFAVSGLMAGLAAFLGAAFYGSASSGDAQGYELYVIAAAVVGGRASSGGAGARSARRSARSSSSSSASRSGPSTSTRTTSGS
jgi:ribose/xylose/arabinose/galactoside ABC-type transport system permease subunit